MYRNTYNDPSSQLASDDKIESQLCDHRLLDLKIRYWTTVPIPNGLAADLISTFLLVELPVYGFFDPDLFIRDLVSQGDRFCSSLLVNALLFWASVCFPSRSLSFHQGVLICNSVHLALYSQLRTPSRIFSWRRHSSCWRRSRLHPLT